MEKEKIIAIWLVAPVAPFEGVLLKKTTINNQEFWTPFEIWKRKKETVLGTLKRFDKEFQKFIPPGKYKVRFTEFDRENINTKIGKVQKIHLQCRLPFKPIMPKSQEVIIVEKKDLKDVEKMMMKGDYQRLLLILNIQTTLF